MTVDQVEATWVAQPEWAGTSRQAIWEDWQTAAAVLRSMVRVYAAWLGGSFLSAKPDPGDMDCVWVIDEEELRAARADRDAARLLGAFSDNALKRGRKPLNIDSFVLVWRRWPGASLRDPEDGQYGMYRGYWDDLWQRERSSSPLAPPGADAIPRRGYAEVVLDGP